MTWLAIVQCCACHGSGDHTPIAGNACSRMQANLAWAMGKLSHCHAGLLAAISDHATGMVKVAPAPARWHLHARHPAVRLTSALHTHARLTVVSDQLGCAHWAQRAVQRLVRLVVIWCSAGAG